jgi:hypothetical protein
VTGEPASSGASRHVQELSEDIRVAILEFLERHPGTSSDVVRQAMRLVERRASELPPPRRARVGNNSSSRTIGGPDE